MSGLSDDQKYNELFENQKVCVSPDKIMSTNIVPITEEYTVKHENVSTVSKLISKFDNRLNRIGPMTPVRKPTLAVSGMKTLKTGKITKKKSWCKLITGLFGWKTVGGIPQQRTEL